MISFVTCEMCLVVVVAFSLEVTTERWLGNVFGDKLRSLDVFFESGCSKANFCPQLYSQGEKAQQEDKQSRNTLLCVVLG